jgi:hypothetical protein
MIRSTLREMDTGQKVQSPQHGVEGTQCVDYEHPAFISVRLGNIASIGNVSKLYRKMYTHCGHIFTAHGYETVRQSGVSEVSALSGFTCHAGLITNELVI